METTHGEADLKRVLANLHLILSELYVLLSFPTSPCRFSCLGMHLQTRG